MAIAKSADGLRLEGDSFPDWNLKFSAVIDKIASITEVNYWNDVTSEVQLVCLVFIQGGGYIVVPETYATLSALVWPPAS